MNTSDFEDLKVHLKSLTEGQLLEMLASNRGEYRQEALTLAQAELHRRGLLGSRDIPTKHLTIGFDGIIDRLILLEQSTGAQVSYRLMHPLSSSYDYLSIQDTAKQIAEFIGLNGLTFIVGIAKQKENVAGHIDLRSEADNVFIEISNEMLNFPYSIDATLCHELCHKWLQIHHIASASEIENEILTDISAVFLGLGKLMLNGCKSGFNSQNPLVVTKTIYTGYLNVDQLALVYRIVCAMRKIPESEYLKDLSSAATVAVRGCQELLGHRFDSLYHSMEDISAAVGVFNKNVILLQRQLADLGKRTMYIRESCCATLDGFAVAGHKSIAKLIEESKELIPDTEPDPALRFLKAIRAKSEIERMNDRVMELGDETRIYLNHLDSVGALLENNSDRFPIPTPDLFIMISCPVDGTKLRVSREPGDLMVKCPKCQYEFVYNTKLPSFAATLHARPPERQKGKQKKS